MKDSCPREGFDNYRINPLASPKDDPVSLGTVPGMSSAPLLLGGSDGSLSSPRRPYGRVDLLARQGLDPQPALIEHAVLGGDVVLVEEAARQEFPTVVGLRREPPDDGAAVVIDQ